MQNMDEEIRAALSDGPEGPDFEEIADVESSPLNQPVKETRQAPPPSGDPGGQSAPESPPVVAAEHAALMADALFGVVNNAIAIGGGFFVEIKKHPEFLEFEELIQIIDEQNERNIKRLKLDEEDKAMLRPILVAVLQKQAKVLTPEQQLVMTGFSILFKKVQVVLTMRSENAMLSERLRGIIREELDRKAPSVPDPRPEAEPEAPQGSEIEQAEEVEVEEVPPRKEKAAAVAPNADRPPYSPKKAGNGGKDALSDSKARKPAT